MYVFSIYEKKASQFPNVSEHDVWVKPYAEADSNLSWIWNSTISVYIRKYFFDESSIGYYLSAVVVSSSNCKATLSPTAPGGGFFYQRWRQDGNRWVEACKAINSTWNISLILMTSLEDCEYLQWRDEYSNCISTSLRIVSREEAESMKILNVIASPLDWYKGHSFR